MLKIPGFISCLTTPIVKAKRGNEKVQFYNLIEYMKWKETMSGNWNIKYYKGLGTSTKDDAKEYFRDINNSLINYVDNTVDNDPQEPITDDKHEHLTIKPKHHLLAGHSNFGSTPPTQSK